VRAWFDAVFPAPTRPQQLGWPAIARGESTLILAPTGTGKTLAAFLWCINRLMFAPVPPRAERCRVLYISPIKALAVDIERNLRSPLVGIAQAALTAGVAFHEPTIAIRTGDTPANERARFARHPADILITTPESIYLLLTSNAREALRSVETVVLDEIHALVPSKRGSHLALSLERLEALVAQGVPSGPVPAVSRLVSTPPEAPRRPAKGLQRIGLSATQRPLDEVARFLGGAAPAPTSKKDRATAPTAGILAEFESANAVPRYRDVTIVDAGAPKRIDLRIEVPLDDMSRLDDLVTLPSGPASQAPVRPSIWSAIHPKLLELVRAHTSTLIFVNSRRLAERISGAVNELAGDILVRAHHGSVAADQRKEIEDRLKLGTLRGLVATSSLELGIDMGAIDLVVQIESPPSVSSGMQRVGRASHHVGGTSAAVIFPKYRGDLVACAAITRAMSAGKVESVHYPRNPLDVLAQQIVAMVAMDPWDANALFTLVRQAAPYAALTRGVFDSVLDMLSGRYPSDEFAELRPRLTWDRVTHQLTSRQGARSVAVINGGTIPDRGLFAVYLAGATRGARVGELDEEMVFESRAGDTIILGATTWRIDQITHDRVTVTPAPGEPGRMPFWHGDAAGRPAEFGREIGEMTRELLAMPRAAAFTRLVEQHSLDANAAENLLRYLEDQTAATARVPSDRDIVIERCRDELGDFRVCVLTPFGSRVHAPWCMAVTAKLRTERGVEVETMWSDDGFVIRMPESEEPLETEWLLPAPAELKDLVLRQLGSTSLFAAKFREASSRALLLPRRRPGIRAPLWQQRKRAADLLAVAARYSSFPMLLETYRECVREVFDLEAATAILQQVQRGTIRVTALDSAKPSPYAGALLFSYIANYIYDGDAPLAERRAQALSIDQSQLAEILGSTDFRELLDKAALAEVEQQLQSLDPDYQARHTDGIHDLLLRLGDLSLEEIQARSTGGSLEDLTAARRAVRVRIAAQTRFIPVEYAARYRDAVGVPLPPGLADVFLEATERPLFELLRRYARTHGPFTTADAAARFGVAPAQIEPVLRHLHAAGKLLEGEFRPEGIHREWCDPDVLQQVRRKTLARLRREVVPAEQHTFVRLLTRWQGVAVPRRGLDALLDTIEILQGAALPASDLEREILPARVLDYSPNDLDALMASGHVVWIGREPLGDRDGRIALYLADALPGLLPPINANENPIASDPSPDREGGVAPDSVMPHPRGTSLGGADPQVRAERPRSALRSQDQPLSTGEWPARGPAADEGVRPTNSSPQLSERAQRIAAALRQMGASFFAPLHQATGGGFPGDTQAALWELVWAGVVTNDTLHPLRNLLYAKDAERPRRELRAGPPGSPEFLRRFRARTGGSHAAEGRWSLVAQRVATPVTPTEWSANIVRQLLARHPIVMRETAIAENIPGGYPVLYPVLRSMEENGTIRRGMFVAGMGAAQFAHTSAIDMLRTLRTEPELPEALHLAACDPANPYGSLLPWPGENHAMARAAGCSIVLINGQLAAFLRRRNPAIRVLLPENEPERTRFARRLAKTLAEGAIRRQTRRSGLLIGEINDAPARDHFLARFLEEAGFVPSPLGLQMRHIQEPTESEPEAT
jgi:ATP-dependent Lhr-like helicase